MQRLLIVMSLLVFCVSCAKKADLSPQATAPKPVSAREQVLQALDAFYNTNNAFDSLLAMRELYSGLQTIAEMESSDYNLVESFFGYAIAPEKARRDLRWLLTATEKAIETNPYVSLHGLSCYYGRTGLCLISGLHE